MHSTATRRLAAGITLAALALLGAPSAALAGEDAPSGTHQHGGSPTATSGTPAPAHTDEMGGMNMGGMNMSGQEDDMDMSGDMGGMDMSEEGGEGAHGHSSGAADAGTTGLDSWAHRGVLIFFGVLNAGALTAAAVLRRRRPHTPGKPRAARTLAAPTGHTA